MELDGGELPLEVVALGKFMVLRDLLLVDVVRSRSLVGMFMLLFSTSLTIFDRKRLDSLAQTLLIPGGDLSLFRPCGSVMTHNLHE